jgi:hypothetical protein
MRTGLAFDLRVAIGVTSHAHVDSTYINGQAQYAKSLHIIMCIFGAHARPYSIIKGVKNMQSETIAQISPIASDHRPRRSRSAPGLVLSDPVNGSGYRTTYDVVMGLSGVCAALERFSDDPINLDLVHRLSMAAKVLSETVVERLSDTA